MSTKHVGRSPPSAGSDGVREHDVCTIAAPAGMIRWVIAGFAVRGVPRASVTLMLMTWLVPLAGAHKIVAHSRAAQPPSNRSEPMAKMRIPRFREAAGSGSGHSTYDPTQVTVIPLCKLPETLWAGSIA